VTDYVGETTHCHMTASLRLSAEDEALLSGNVFGGGKH
jgi:hypothetical protein